MSALQGVPVPDAGHETLKLMGDVAVLSDHGWRLGMVERIYKQHARGKTDWVNPVDLSEGKRPKDVHIECTWYTPKPGSDTIYKNDNHRDIKSVPLESVSTVIKMLHDKTEDEFRLCASDRLWLNENEPQ